MTPVSIEVAQKDQVRLGLRSLSKAKLEAVGKDQLRAPGPSRLKAGVGV